MNSQSHWLTNLAKVVASTLIAVTAISPIASAVLVKTESAQSEYVIRQPLNLYTEENNAKFSSSTNQAKPKVRLPDTRNAIGAQRMAKIISRSHSWYSKKQFKCLVELWNRESSWNYQAENSSSGAYGIAQALPPSKMDVVAKDWIKNPSTQIAWGLKYINERYGTPCKALRHHDLNGWY